MSCGPGSRPSANICMQGVSRQPCNRVYHRTVMWRLPTSISKLIRGIHHDKSALDEKESVKEDFQKAADKGEGGRGVKPKAPEPAGSRMIRDHAPSMDMKPAGQMRQIPDRLAAARRLEAERREAEERNRQARMAETARALAARREGREDALEV